MYRWIESLALEDGTIRNLPFHQKRVDRTLGHFQGVPFNLAALLSKLELPKLGLHKIRIVYDLNTIVDIQITPYQPRVLKTFQVVDGGDVLYDYKYENRDCLNVLKQAVDADEVIITRLGAVSDTSFSNLIFFDGTEWLTPKEPLLKGTQRAYLLETRAIKEATILVKDIASFECFKLINAMLSFNASPTYSIAQIRV